MSTPAGKQARRAPSRGLARQGFIEFAVQLFLGPLALLVFLALKNLAGGGISFRARASPAGMLLAAAVNAAFFPPHLGWQRSNRRG